MTNLDEELALFEKEIAEIDQALTNTETHVGYEDATISAEPTTGASSSSEPLNLPPLQPPSFLGQVSLPVVSPFVANTLTRSSLPVPAVPFLPHQLRAPVPPALSLPRPPIAVSAAATIEGAPSFYEARPVNTIPQEFLRTQALQSDIDKMNYKKQTDPFKKRIKEQQTKKKFVRSGGGQVWEDPSLAEWDENDFRVFCGDLGNEVSDELLAKAFRKYPSFQKAKVVRESRSNKSKGYGFVSFRDSDDYIRAMREMDGKYVGNRPIKLRKSNWKDRNMDVIKQKKKQKKDLGIFA